MIVTVFTDIAITDARGSARGAGDRRGEPARSRSSRSRSVPPGRRAAAGRPWSMPVFGFPEPAAAALGSPTASQVALRQRRYAGPSRRAVDEAAARALVQSALACGGGWLRADEVARLLSARTACRCARSASSSTPDAAVAAAAEFGYPVALKLAAGGVHKSDIGGVRLDLADRRAGALRPPWTWTASTGDRGGHPLLVQPMVCGGIELIAGAVHDAQFGPLVMLGAGGVLTDVLGDRYVPARAAIPHPGRARCSASSARPSCSTVSAAGRRRHEPAVERRPGSVAALVADLPEIAELDLNPLVCRGDAAMALDARVRVAPSPYHPDPLVRQLRGPMASPPGVGERAVR